MQMLLIRNNTILINEHMKPYIIIVKYQRNEIMLMQIDRCIDRSRTF